jgi:hypothetical protein
VKTKRINVISNVLKIKIEEDFLKYIHQNLSCFDGYIYKESIYQNGVFDIYSPVPVNHTFHCRRQELDDAVEDYVHTPSEGVVDSPQTDYFESDRRHIIEENKPVSNLDIPMKRAKRFNYLTYNILIN